MILASVVAIAGAMVFRGLEADPVVDPSGQLSQARVALDAGDLEAAGILLREVESRLAQHPDLIGQYHLLVADHRARSVMPVRTAPANQATQVVEAYRQAGRDGIELDLPRRLLLAQAIMASGADEEALAAFDTLAGELRQRGESDLLAVVNEDRFVLRQRGIERRRREGAPTAEIRREVDLLLSEQPGLAIDAWAVLLDARLRLQDDEVDGLVQDLGLAMHRLEGRIAGAGDGAVRIAWPELWVVLGHAYRQELQLPARARECYHIALDRLQAAGEIAAEAHLSLGELRVASARRDVTLGNLVEDLTSAESRYSQVLAVTDATLEQTLLAEVGLLEVDVLRSDQIGIVDRMDRLSPLLSVSDEAIGREARERAVSLGIEAAERGSLAAMEVPRDDAVVLFDAVAVYAEFVDRFARNPEDRRRGLEFMAVAQERAAGLMLSAHLGGEDPRAEGTLGRAPVEVRLDAARRFARAADAMDLIEDSLEGDDPDRFLVLWRAATLHDKAGAVEPSLARYARFVNSQSPEARLWPEAVYRIAAAHHALRNLGEAEVAYRRLLEQMGDSRDEVSEFTTRAKVGLARVLMEVGGETAIPEAESLLHHVLAGTARDAVEPSVPEYRIALLQLVRLLGDAGRWQEQAGRGDEWLQRYPDDSRWGELAALTGAAFLRHAEEVDRVSRDDVADSSPSVMAALEEERRRSLSLAAARLEDAIRALASKGRGSLDPLEARLLRSAYLHRGIVADGRGDASLSIRLHRETEQRFAGEPVAVAALIFMADVADRAGDHEVAAAATARARKRLQHLHRDALGLASTVDSLGPELFVGAGEEALGRWLSAFPPGVGVAVGGEDGS